GHFEIAAADLAHRSDKQVPEGMVAQAFGRLAALEAILEEVCHRRFRVSQRYKAAPDISWRQDIELLLELAGRAAVICNRHAGRDIVGVLLEAPQHGAETRAASDNDNAGPLRKVAVPVHRI